MKEDLYPHEWIMKNIDLIILFSVISITAIMASMEIVYLTTSSSLNDTEMLKMYNITSFNKTPFDPDIQFGPIILLIIFFISLFIVALSKDD